MNNINYTQHKKHRKPVAITAPTGLTAPTGATSLTGLTFRLTYSSFIVPYRDSFEGATLHKNFSKKVLDFST
jgi:hypothetical protein